MTGRRALGSPYAGPIRVLRGSVVGAASIGLSLSGHTIAGGARPPTLVLLLLTVAASVLCVAMSALEWTGRRLAGVLLVTQGGLHLAFDIGSHHRATGPAATMIGWHLAASAVTIVVIRYAEGALATLVDRAALRRPRRILDAFANVPAARSARVVARLAAQPSRIADLLLPARAPPTAS